MITSILTTIVFLPMVLSNGVALATGTTYYLDCAGNDSNPGTSSTQAWRSLSKANNASFAPGDSLLLKRGCTWSGTLEARWQGTQAAPIRIGAYGSGELPKIQDGYSSSVRIRGSYQIIENLHATLSQPPNPAAACNNQPVAWKIGFSFDPGSSYNTLQYSKATKNAMGIYLDDNSHHNQVLNNTLTNNNVLWRLDTNDSIGAMGILLHGNDHEIAYNYFQNNKALCSYNGTIESNSIEIYNAKRASIHNNIAFGDRVFSEIGSSATAQSEDITFAYNLHVTAYSGVQDDPNKKGARFIVTRGQGHAYGPVWRTRLYNNTVYYTGEDSTAVVCQQCGPNILTLKNNAFVVKFKAVYIGPDGSSQYQPDESHNLFWSPSGAPTNPHFVQNLPTDNTSFQANPRFINPSTDPANYDFRLQSGSPAIDRGTSGSGYGRDLDNSPTPQGNGFDLGAYEFRSGSSALQYIASDQFSRSLVNSWGNADNGGAYSLTGNVANFDVDGAASTIEIPTASQGRAAQLRSVTAQDLDILFRVKTNKLASGNNQLAYFIVRQISNNTEYRGQIRFSTSRTVHLRAIRINNGSWGNLGLEVRVAGITHAANSYIWVRAQVVGVNPTTIRMKAWADGQPEPSAWQYAVTDSTASLQAPGSVGLRGNLPASVSNVPVLFTFDDFSVASASTSVTTNGDDAVIYPSDWLFLPFVSSEH